MDYQITEETLWRVESVMRQLRLIRDMLSYANQDDINFHIRPNDLLQFIEVNSDTLKGVIDAVHDRHSASVKHTIRGADLANMMLFCSDLDSASMGGEFYAVEGKLIAAAQHSQEMMLPLQTWKKVMNHKAEKSSAAVRKAGSKSSRLGGLAKNASKAVAPAASGVAA